MMKLVVFWEGIIEYSGMWCNGRLMQFEVSVFVENYKLDVEKVFYGEIVLFEEELFILVFGDLDMLEVYFFGIVGDGMQCVFSCEVSVFCDYLDWLLSLQEWQIVLFNDCILMGKQLMVTRISIVCVFVMFGERMNMEDDVLVFYIISHGSDNYEISL